MQDPKRILIAVAEAFHVSVPAIMGKDRSRRTALARHVAMWLMREDGMSYPEIGREMGHRDHTSAMHAVRKVSALVTSDAEMLGTVYGIKQAAGEERVSA